MDKIVSYGVQYEDVVIEYYGMFGEVKLNSELLDLDFFLDKGDKSKEEVDFINDLRRVGVIP